MQRIYLVGFMGSGKSTVAKALAKVSKMSMFDLDKVIEQKAGQRISDIFYAHGEEFFRKLEHDALLETTKQTGIISTGGGIVEREDNRNILSQQYVVFLETAWSEIVERLKDDQERPLWHQDLEVKKQLFDHRQVLYKEVSQFVINTTYRSPENIAQAILKNIHK